MKRKDGYYWVKINLVSKQWIIAEWTQYSEGSQFGKAWGGFSLEGRELEAHNILEVDEKQIVRPKPVVLKIILKNLLK